MITDLKYKIKWAWQRVVRGYDDRLFWSMAEYLDPMVVAHVKNQRGQSHGHPANLTEKRWNKVLDTILKGFVEEPDILKNGHTTASWRKYHKDRTEALVLLAYYWDNLWD